MNLETMNATEMEKSFRFALKIARGTEAGSVAWDDVHVVYAAGIDRSGSFAYRSCKIAERLGVTDHNLYRAAR